MPSRLDVNCGHAVFTIPAMAQTLFQIANDFAYTFNQATGAPMLGGSFIHDTFAGLARCNAIALMTEAGAKGGNWRILRSYDMYLFILQASSHDAFSVRLNVSFV